ncbi:MAG: hypothetical protein ABIO68_02160 [Sphingomicrobium sp.]
MRKQMMEDAAFEVAAQVRAVEESIENALVELAGLQSKMVHARGVTNAGFANSHSAFEQLAATTTGLIAARGGIAHCHVALVEARKDIPGLRTIAFGPMDCPDTKAEQGLRIVA